MTVRFRFVLAALGATLVAACGGGSEGPFDERPPGIVLSAAPSTVVAYQGESVGLRVDTPSATAADLPAGYAFDLDEVAGNIDVTTAPCPSGAGSRACQDWTITPRAGSVPGEYTVNVNSVGSRAGVGTTTFRLVVVASPRPAHGGAVTVAASTGHTLVINDGGQVFAAGTNLQAQARLGYLRLPLPLDTQARPVPEPQSIPSFIAAPLPPADRWLSVAAGQGYSLAVRDEGNGAGTVWAWGHNNEGQLGFAPSGTNDPFQFAARQVPGLSDVRAVATSTTGAGDNKSQALLADGRVLGWFSDDFQDNLYPYCEFRPGIAGCAGPLADVRALAAGGGAALFLKNDGTVWRGRRYHFGAERLVGQLPASAGIAVTGAATGIVLGADGTVWQHDVFDTAPDEVTQVAGLADVTAVAGGRNELIDVAYALRSDGSVWMWRPGRDAPQRVNGLANVRAIGPDLAITADCTAGGALWRVHLDRVAVDPGTPTVYHVTRVPGFGEGDGCASAPTAEIALTVAGQGRVVSDPAALDCGATCRAAFPLGQRVQLHPAPASGWKFSSWRGGEACSATGAVLVAADVTCEAVFVEGGERRLSVRVDGAGRITASPAGIDCGLDCNESYDFDTDLTLGYQAARGYQFDRYTGDADCTDARLRMDAPKSCIGHFVPRPAPGVAVGLTATAGVFSIRLRWDAECCSVAHYTLERADASGAFVVVAADIAATATEYTDPGLAPGTTYTYRLTGRNTNGAGAPATVSATTLAAAPVTLTVAVNGNGTVTSVPAGIDCGADCSESYAYGTQVRLTAAPAVNQIFGGFGGDADCSDGTVTMTLRFSGSGFTCTATFLPRPGSGWQQLGAALTDGSGVPPSYSLALDDNLFDAPVVAYVEVSPPMDPARLYVKRLDGIVWNVLGSGALNAGSATAASDPSLATRLGTAPHVAWSQGNGVQQNVFVARFNGAAWESVGPPGIPLNYVAGSRAVRPSLAFDVSGLPQVAWIEGGAVKFKRFDGTNWLPSVLGGEGPVSSDVDRVRLATTPFAPVIAWTEGTVNDRRLKVTHGQSFAPLGAQVNAPFNVPVTITHFGLRPDENGAIVMWTQDERPFVVFARQWDGSTWVDYGAPPVAIDTNLLWSFAVARRSVGVAFSLQPLASASFTTLFLRSSGQWAPVPALLSPAPLRNIEVEFPRSDEPIVAGVLDNGAAPRELRVYRYFP